MMHGVPQGAKPVAKIAVAGDPARADFVRHLLWAVIECKPQQQDKIHEEGTVH